MIQKVILIILCALSIAKGQENLYDLSNSKKYAAYLLSSGQFKAAVQEYERVVFLDPQDLTAKQQLIESYRLSTEYLKGINRVQSLYPSLQDMPRDHAISYSKLLLSHRDWDLATQFWNGSSTINETDKLILNSTIHIFEGDFTQAQKTLKALEDSENALAQSYISIVDRGLNGKRKSPFLAGFLSTAVPGLGKAYTGDWKDGIVSLIFTGGLAFQAYRNFVNRGVNDWRPWTYTAIGTGFYIGNIVGSVKSAKDRNRKRINILQHEASDNFNFYF